MYAIAFRRLRYDGNGKHLSTVVAATKSTLKKCVPQQTEEINFRDS
jgi:hypothetical protein